MHSTVVLKCQLQDIPTQKQGNKAITAQEDYGRPIDPYPCCPIGGTNNEPSLVLGMTNHYKSRIRIADLENTPVTGSDTGIWKFSYLAEGGRGNMSKGNGMTVNTSYVNVWATLNKLPIQTPKLGCHVRNSKLKDYPKEWMDQTGWSHTVIPYRDSNLYPHLNCLKLLFLFSPP